MNDTDFAGAQWVSRPVPPARGIARQIPGTRTDLIGPGFTLGQGVAAEEPVTAVNIDLRGPTDADPYTADVAFRLTLGRPRRHQPRTHRIPRRILEQGPKLEPATINWDVPRAGLSDEYYLYYFGASRPTFRRFVLDPVTAYTIDVIDTWNMTIHHARYLPWPVHHRNAG